MIKLGIRRNLIYPTMIIVFTLIRLIFSTIMSVKFTFQDCILLGLIMFLSEFLFGFLFLRGYVNFSINKKNKNNEVQFLENKLIRPENKSIPDNCFKIYLLIFFISFLDSIEFTLKTNYLPKFGNKFNSLEIRLRGIAIISSALLCLILLKFPFYKHQIISLLIIIICLITIIIIEYLNNSDLKVLTEVLLLIFFGHFFNSYKDVLEKYLLDYDDLNPFKTIMIEGVFGLIFTLFYCFIENPLIGLNEFYNNKNINYNNKYKTIILIFFFILYFICSGGKNIYRVITNRLYSPITKSLADAILDPLLIIYSFFDKNLYHDNSKFIPNLILSSILVFCACIYNELFVIFCCNIEKDTYIIVSERAKTIDENCENDNKYQIDGYIINLNNEDNKSIN